ncbi:hypothetical protein P170DRAFT_477083 [Aspergillus steynii IBT 23096]|uniref:Amino acid transporter transmembrane domain-containing protein n=1 Tax=Aspergillus steynii IBT 23096 TaxID=1392250 RepID=A0A2I2G6F5_9EURO|nr:uncharacterized protein P170DRAFT_477083 [Aspergillus steynii IBT 23096]PLB48467.1 hypothetical protein P170DRAFT_477083 [Aspergillus steynii IBT 23096]
MSVPLNDPEAGYPVPTGDKTEDKDQKKGHDDEVPMDDPFGNEEMAEIRYRTMSWWKCGMLMVAENISLGILSLPSAVATLGMVPAAVLIVFLAGLSWYTGYVIGQFKLRYPHVHNMGDAGEILFGQIGREVFGIGQLLLLIFLMASHILTFSILMNTLTEHGTCTITFSVIGLIICFIGALPQTMEKVYWMSIVSFLSILSATIAAMVAIGVESNASVPVNVVTKTSFESGFLAVTNIIFAYTAHVAFFGFISEMEEPKTFPRSIAMLQIVDTIMYLVAALVIYRLAGPDVKSPALSSAGRVMKKVCYGLAIPTVIIAGVIFGHVAAKYIFVRLFRGSEHMHSRTFIGVGSWLGIGVGVWIIAWVVAESIPVFNDMLSLISSLFGSFFSYGIPAALWLYMNKGQYGESLRKCLLTACNLVILAIACGMCGMGLYVSGRSISQNSSSASWSCADNSS